MINWNLLGIEPTKDTSAIKKAYRAALALTNPEDKPEEFMALRETYEEAMVYARSAEEDPEEDNNDADSALTRDLLPQDHPAYGWTKELQALYKDFPRRIHAENWSALVSHPLCSRIDTAEDVKDALMRFLMEWWFVPDSVIRALDQVYHFEENRDAYISRYPSDFVDAILLTPLHREAGGLEYNLFDAAPDADYDSYINSYYILTGHVNRGEAEEAWQTISQMEDLNIYHPYINIEKAKLYLSAGQDDLALAEMEAVWPTYDCSPSVCCMCGEVLLVKEEFPEARERFSKALELHKESRWGRIGMAEACFGMKDYDEADKWVDEILSMDRYSPRGKALEEQIQLAQKEVLLEKLADEDATAEERIKLSVIYIDQGDFEPAREILTGFTCKDHKKEAQRIHYLATAELDLEDYESSAANFLAAENLLRQLMDVTADEEELEKLKDNLSRTMVMRSVALENLDQMEEAMAVIVNASIDFPNQSMVLCRKSELHYELKQFQEAIDAATESIRLDDTFHLPYRIRGNAYYELGHYNNAFDDCNTCIDIYGGDIEAFFCKINILIEVNETEAAFQELDGLEAQVQGTQITFLRGKAHEAAGNLREARDAYLKVLEMHRDKDRNIFWPAEAQSLAGTYYRLYQVLQRIYETEGGSEYWRAAQKYLKEGVKLYPADLDLITELAGEFYGQSQHKDAQKLYERMVELAPTGRHYAQLAGNELQLDMFAAATVHLQKAEELAPQLTYSKILLCALNTHIENYEQALVHIDRARQCAEDNEEVWYRILRDKAMVLCRMKQFDKALECYDENFRLYGKEEDISTAMEVLRMDGRFAEAISMGERYLSEYPEGKNHLVLEELKYTVMYTEDLEAFQRYSEMDDRTYMRNYQAGRFHMYHQDSYKKALSHFEKAAEVKNQINNYIDMAKLYLKLKNTKKAYEFAGKVLDCVPENFMDCGYNRAFYLARSAEALAILGKYEEAMHRLDQAVHGRKCAFCKYPGCIDAYCAYVYICCIRGDEKKMNEYLQAGLEISLYDYDLKNLPDHFMKKRGFFR